VIYREKSLGQMRKKFLRTLKKIVPFDMGTFKLIRRDSAGTHRLVNAVTCSEYGKEFEDDFVSRYENEFGEVDYAKWIFNGQDSLVYRETDLIDDSARKNNLFYQEYLKPAGLIYISGISLIKDKARLGSLALYRTEKSGDFTDKDIYILEKIFPHLQNKLFEIAGDIENAKTVPHVLRHKYGITSRETEIIKEIFQGKSNSEIGTSLFISDNTVKKHITSIFAKTEVTSRLKLIRMISELNITP
jgi:DNA-binding CsgD family transcriptional regulator